MIDRSLNAGRIVIALDVLCALLFALTAAVFGNIARIPGSIGHFLEMRVTLLNVGFAAGFVLAWIYWLNLFDLYRLDSHGILRKLWAASKASAVMGVALWVFLVISRTQGPPRRIAFIFFVLSFSFEAMRMIAYSMVHAWIASRDPRRVLIVGTGRKAAKAWRQIRTRHHSTVNLIGFVDDRPVSEMAPDVVDRYLGSVDSLSELLLRNVVDEVLIALPTKSCYDTIQRAIGIAEEVGVEVVYMQDLYVTTLKTRTQPAPEVFSELVPRHDQYMATQALKRFVDVVGATFGLILLAPLFLVVAIAIKATSEGPVFFVQERYGYRRRLFRMIKFRSMVQNAPALMAQLESRNEATGPIFKIRQDPRVTPMGRFLRTTSIDELPQLINVLKGDMSLVGPRPMSVRDVSRFSEAILMRRFSVKPGITGLWQVSGRSETSFDQWMRFDFDYIDDWSLGLDFRILARTVTAVLKRSGAA